MNAGTLCESVNADASVGRILQVDWPVFHCEESRCTRFFTNKLTRARIKADASKGKMLMQARIKADSSQGKG